MDNFFGAVESGPFQGGMARQPGSFRPQPGSFRPQWGGAPQGPTSGGAPGQSGPASGQPQGGGAPMGILEILKAMGQNPQAAGTQGQNPNAPVGAQGSVMNALTGGAPRQGSVFAGLQSLFGSGAQQPQQGGASGAASAQPGAPAMQSQPTAPAAPAQKNFAALAAQYGLPSDGYLAQHLFG